MNPERWQQIKLIYNAALDRNETSRAEFLQDVCAGDDELAYEVDSLLAAAARASGFIEEPAAENQFFTDGADSLIGKDIGHYRLVAEIGRGGMGVVYHAERSDGEFEQKVALKLVRGGLDQGEMQRRFLHERQILASLEHPNIARLIDGGTTPKGQPFLAMEYVDGRQLIEFCNNIGLTINERLTLFRDICNAVAHAHRNLIVHRDLKPSNILVTDDRVPKLLDFGIAKLLEPRRDQKQTETGLRPFTPDYASPEQLLGKPITTSADIYSLGLVLFELLSGCKPFDVKGGSVEEKIATVANTEPDAMVTALKRHTDDNLLDKISRERSVSPESLKNSLSGDLETIVQKALRKEPANRYLSAEELGDDIRRFSVHLPIHARPATFRYRSAKFIRRNSFAAAAGALVLVTLIAGVIATLWQSSVARAERDRARLEQVKAERISAFLQKLMLTASPTWNAPGFGLDEDVTLIEAIDEAANRAKIEFADQPDILATMQHSFGLIYLTRGRYDDAEVNLLAASEAALQLYGEDHQDTVQNMRDLAALLMVKGDYGRSSEYYGRALATYRRRLAENTTEGNTLLGFVGSLSDVGLLNRLRGEPKTAESYLREALHLSEGLVGNERAVLAIVLGHLAMARHDQGDAALAEELLRRSISEYRSLPGNQRSETGGSLVNLGIVLKEKGRYAEADASIREGLDIYGKLLGNGHPYYQFAKAQLADLQLATGDLQAAEETARTSLEIIRRALPEGHPTLAYPLTTLGLALTRRGRHVAGESYLRESLEIRRRVMNSKFWRVAETEGALGECLAAQKKYTDAKPLLQASYEKMRVMLSSDDPRTLLASHRLATVRN